MGITNCLYISQLWAPYMDAESSPHDVGIGQTTNYDPKFCNCAG